MIPGPQGMIIRAADPADLPLVLRIENRSFTDPWSVDALFSELHTDAMRLPLAAEIDGELCGYLMAWIVADQLHVLNIATDPRRLRQGVGRGLLARAVELAKPRGVVEITLEVRESNQPALTFYRRLGFQEAGLRPGYYQDNGENAIIMNAPATAFEAD